MTSGMQKTHDLSSACVINSEPRTITKSGFAKLIGITPGRISQLIKQGLPVEQGGKIDVARGRIWITENVNPVRSAAQRPDRLPLGDDFQKISLTKERARLAKEQADSAALKNAALRKELVPASEIEQEWSDILRRVRASILAVPERLRSEVSSLAASDIEAIDAELRRVLEDIANDA